jgi:hypothetical protein
VVVAGLPLTVRVARVTASTPTTTPAKRREPAAPAARPADDDEGTINPFGKKP